MSTRKNHHYVPQFYLRNFSPTEDKKVIGLYNFKNEFFIKNAPIKHQACQKYLYGTDDEIENGLSNLEYLTSLTIQKIFKSNEPPPENSIYIKILKEFILSQLSRTIKAGKDVNDFLASNLRESFKLSSVYKEEYKDITFRHTEPTLFSLIHSMQALPLMNYLSCKLVLNHSEDSLITSDNPVVRYNQFFENNKVTYGGNGLAIKGLEIFLPLNSRMLLILYDPLVYKLNERKDKTLIITSADDILALNALQYINSDSQLFFGNEVSKNYLIQIIEKFKIKKDKSITSSKTFEAQKVSKGDKNFRVVSKFPVPHIQLDLSFIKLTKAAKKFNFGNEVFYLRHPSFKTFKSKKDEVLLNI